MRRVLLIVVILTAVAGAGYFGYQRYVAATAPASPDVQVLTIGRGNVTAFISATGTLLPEKQTNLTFQSAGTITRIAVKAGDTVKTGQVLAQLDTKDLELALRQSQIGLRTAQAQLAQLKASTAASDLAAAQAVLASAQAAYQQLLVGADADQQAAARAAVEQSRVVLEQAQQSYDRIKDMPNAGMLPPALQLQQATIGFETAQAQFRVTTRGANQSQIAAAQAQVAQAQASLDRLQRGPSKEQIEITEAAVDQAQVAVDSAQRRLDSARITAPWDGTVTAVNIVEGALAQPGTPAIPLADQSVLHINVQVDEVDIANIAIGQPVEIELDALPDKRLTGKVTYVAPAASADPTGIIAYLVRIDFDAGNAPVRSGMSATASITSSSRQNVLVVLNRAVSLDRETGKTFVEKQVDGALQKIEIRLGLRDELQSEVREGLSEGDQIVIRKVSSLERLQQSFTGMGN